MPQLETIHKANTLNISIGDLGDKQKDSFAPFAPFAAFAHPAPMPYNLPKWQMRDMFAF